MSLQIHTRYLTFSLKKTWVKAAVKVNIKVRFKVYLLCLHISTKPTAFLSCVTVTSQAAYE